MISRALVIVLAFGVALARASQGAVIETLGLTALGVGLVFLKLADSKPQLRLYAWASFGVTACAMAVVFLRM